MSHGLCDFFFPALTRGFMVVWPKRSKDSIFSGRELLCVSFFFFFWSHLVNIIWYIYQSINCLAPIAKDQLANKIFALFFEAKTRRSRCWQECFLPRPLSLTCSWSLSSPLHVVICQCVHVPGVSQCVQTFSYRTPVILN